MKILLIGYGKMGKAIEAIVTDRGHSIVGRLEASNHAELLKFNGTNTDVAIEFSQPESAFDNIKYCLENGIPIISGTTGWLDKMPEVEALCIENKGTFFYASNYSIGVNLFFKLNEQLAKMMVGQNYSTSIEEVHHTQKKDAPSGTAISLAEGIIKNNAQLREWSLNSKGVDTIPIKAERIDNVPGTHIVKYSSAIDDIEIKHTAHSRQGFALGAVMVAEWIENKKGVLSMADFLEDLKINP
ncbi:MAG TPA: 4-hydroxy-tetrahydrodipicolinate reductase [Fulvivirga sp.]|nr:4-hydroxy-tetrahydrodipicolinate reductase [Fulvivirga sp.]